MSDSVRYYLGIAFVLFVLADVMTFGYFYPRNEILFTTASLTDVATLEKVWSEWNAMNWVRSLFILVGVGFSFWSLHKIYTFK